MVDMNKLKVGTIIRFKKGTDASPYFINRNWIGKRLQYLGLVVNSDIINYKVLDYINAAHKEGTIKSDIMVSTFKDCMEVVVERKNHLPRWF